MSGDVDGKIAIITGAAGGIGREIAKLFDEKGILLSLADVDRGGLERLSLELSGSPLIVECDVTDRESVSGLIERTVSEMGGLDILVSNAGVIRPELFEDASYENIDLQVGVNLMGAVHVTREAIPAMKQRGGGHIVMIVSLAGLIPETRAAVYTTTKFGLRGLGLTLNLELRNRNIMVSNVFPDSVATPMLEYEAKHGGSPLTFLGEPLKTEAVAAAVWKAIEKKKIEVYVPHSMGILSKIASLFPALIPLLWPLLEKAGERRMRKKGIRTDIVS